MESVLEEMRRRPGRFKSHPILRNRNEYTGSLASVTDFIAKNASNENAFIIAYNEDVDVIRDFLKRSFESAHTDYISGGLFICSPINIDISLANAETLMQTQLKHVYVFLELGVGNAGLVTLENYFAKRNKNAPIYMDIVAIETENEQAKHRMRQLNVGYPQTC